LYFLTKKFPGLSKNCFAKHKDRGQTLKIYSPFKVTTTVSTLSLPMRGDSNSSEMSPYFHMVRILIKLYIMVFVYLLIIKICFLWKVHQVFSSLVKILLILFETFKFFHKSGLQNMYIINEIFKKWKIFF
jgi:hypothetical protein